jgi:hypothetical protein
MEGTITMTDKKKEEPTTTEEAAATPDVQPDRDQIIKETEATHKAVAKRVDLVNSAPSEDEVKDPTPKQEENLPYNISQWNGINNYECKLCSWSTVDGENQILDHYIRSHTAPVAQVNPNAPKPLFLDRNGNPITSFGTGG